MKLVLLLTLSAILLGLLNALVVPQLTLRKDLKADATNRRTTSLWASTDKDQNKLFQLNIPINPPDLSNLSPPDLSNLSPPDPAKVYSAARTKLGLQDKHFVESSFFISAPLLASIASFALYPTTAVWFHNMVNYLSNNNWEPVDGGQLQWSILLPALNGVVMTAISLLYANLISTTGSQLRQRQITIHESLSNEVAALRNLIQLLPYYPEKARPSFAKQLRDYTVTLMEEIANTDPQDLRAANQPLTDFRNYLHYWSLSEEPGHGIHPNIRERSYETLQAISHARNARITSLQTKFPNLHYVTIAALTLTILLIFLLETDRKVILFLDKFQIRSVWALLVGTVTAICCIGVDLAYPFIGTYTVPADQLLLDNDELLQLIAATNNTSSPTTTQQQQQQPTSFPLFQSYSMDNKPTNPPSVDDIPHSTNPVRAASSNRESAADGGMSLYDQYRKSQQSNSSDPRP
jgi:Protein of unknown function (DUF4239)